MGKNSYSKRRPSLIVVAHGDGAKGDVPTCHEGPGAPVETIIRQLYRKLGTERKNGGAQVGDPPLDRRSNHRPRLSRSLSATSTSPNPTCRATDGEGVPNDYVCN